MKARSLFGRDFSQKPQNATIQWSILWCALFWMRWCYFWACFTPLGSSGATEVTATPLRTILCCFSSVGRNFQAKHITLLTPQLRLPWKTFDCCAGRWWTVLGVQHNDDLWRQVHSFGCNFLQRPKNATIKQSILCYNLWQIQWCHFGPCFTFFGCSGAAHVTAAPLSNTSIAVFPLLVKTFWLNTSFFDSTTPSTLKYVWLLCLKVVKDFGSSLRRGSSPIRQGLDCESRQQEVLIRPFVVRWEFEFLIQKA